VGNAIKEMRDKKATGYDVVPEDLWGTDGYRIMTELYQHI